MLCLTLFAAGGCSQESIEISQQPVPAAVAKAPSSRPIVQEWTVAGLRRDLRHVSKGRSYENGKRMYSVARCDQCHQMNKVGGELGPDLTGVAGRISRAALLREIIEPSKQILQQYQSHLVLTTAGMTHQGLVQGQDGEFLYLASDPEKPTEVIKSPLEEI